MSALRLNKTISLEDCGLYCPYAEDETHCHSFRYCFELPGISHSGARRQMDKWHRDNHVWFAELSIVVSFRLCLIHSRRCGEGLRALHASMQHHHEWRSLVLFEVFQIEGTQAE